MKSKRLTRQIFAAMWSRIGIIGWVIALIKPLLFLIGRLSDMEFIITYWSEFRAFLDSGLGTFTSVVFGMSVVGYSIIHASHAEIDPEISIAEGKRYNSSNDPSDEDARPRNTLNSPIPSENFTDLSASLRTLYGKLGSCYVRDQIDTAGGDEEGKLRVMARTICGLADLFGIRVPSDKIEKIGREEIDKLEFCEFSSCLRSTESKNPHLVWRALMLKTEDLDRATAHILNVRRNSALQIS